VVHRAAILLGLFLVILTLTILGVIVAVILALAASCTKRSIIVLIHHMIFRPELIMLHLLVAI